MNITKYVRNYKFSGAIEDRIRKHSEEYFVLASLKYCFPEEFDGLQKRQYESPDLQNKEADMGIEVVTATTQEERQLNSMFRMFKKAESCKEREKIRISIENRGGLINGLLTSYPGRTEENDKELVRHCYGDKAGKIEEYHEQCSTLGLAIIIDTPLSIFEDSDQWGKWFPEENGFDFAIILHWEGIEIYDFKSKEYKRKRIEKENREALHTIARLTTEGIISEDDEIWN